MSFGGRLKAVLKKRGWSQQDLADTLGVSQSAVSDWARDENLPEGRFLIQMPGLFGVSGHWLLTGEDRDTLGGPTASALREELRSRVLAALEAVLAPTAPAAAGSGPGASGGNQGGKASDPLDHETEDVESVRRPQPGAPRKPRRSSGQG